MTPEEKLAKIISIYDAERPLPNGAGYSSSHARYNLEAALIDMERTGRGDTVCCNTVKRVVQQLADIETVLGI